MMCPHCGRDTEEEIKKEISIKCKDGKTWSPKPEKIKQWTRAYPDIDIYGVLEAMQSSAEAGGYKYTHRGMNRAVAKWLGNAREWGQNQLVPRDRREDGDDYDF